MGRHITEAGKIAQGYCKNNPDMKNRTLARLMRKEMPEMYTSIENSRHYVRTCRGEMGTKHREQRQDKSCYRNPEATILAAHREKTDPRIH